MKRITIQKRASVQDYARLAARTSPVINGQDHILGALGEIIGDVSGIFSGGSGSGKMSKKTFYQKRDAFYHAAELAGKPVQTLPGNPFAKFSHASIKDSPFKDYTRDWQNFVIAVKTYYPEFILPTGEVADVPVPQGPTPVQAAKELKPIIDDAIRNTGAKPTGDIQEDLKIFGEGVVAPATGKDLSNAGGEALANAAMEFISTLIEKKQSGEQLPSGYDKIATAGMKLTENVESKVRQRVEGKVGGFVTSNALLIGGGLLLLLVAVLAKK